MKQVNVAEIKDHFSDYLKDVEAGDDVGICRRNVLVARLTAAKAQPPQPNKTTLGCGQGTVKFMSDLTEPIIESSDWNMLGGVFSDEPHS
jgi:antitoxin (DNA-binding transcriptional repressor) of toxin-antitoxin stability system